MSILQCIFLLIISSLFRGLGSEIGLPLLSSTPTSSSPASCRSSSPSAAIIPNPDRHVGEHPLQRGYFTTAMQSEYLPLPTILPTSSSHNEPKRKRRTSLESDLSLTDEDSSFSTFESSNDSQMSESKSEFNVRPSKRVRRTLHLEENDGEADETSSEESEQSSPSEATTSSSNSSGASKISYPYSPISSEDAIEPYSPGEVLIEEEYVPTDLQHLDFSPPSLDTVLGTVSDLFYPNLPSPARNDNLYQALDWMENQPVTRSSTWA